MLTYIKQSAGKKLICQWGIWVSLTNWGSEKAWLVFWKVWKGQKGLFCLYDRRGCGCGNDVKVKNIKPSQKKSVFLLKDAAASTLVQLNVWSEQIVEPRQCSTHGWPICSLRFCVKGFDGRLMSAGLPADIPTLTRFMLLLKVGLESHWSHLFDRR